MISSVADLGKHAEGPASPADEAVVTPPQPVLGVMAAPRGPGYDAGYQKGGVAAVGGASVTVGGYDTVVTAVVVVTARWRNSAKFSRQGITGVKAAPVTDRVQLVCTDPLIGLP